MTLREELDALCNAELDERCGYAYARGDLIPADEISDDSDRMAAAVAIAQAALSDEVRELWEAADRLRFIPADDRCEAFVSGHAVDADALHAAVEALRERMER